MTGIVKKILLSSGIAFSALAGNALPPEDSIKVVKGQVSSLTGTNQVIVTFSPLTNKFHTAFIKDLVYSRTINLGHSRTITYKFQ